jgi:hypothetical protein
LPGTLDADNNGNPFDGGNAIANAFASPTRAISVNYDDAVLAVDFSQIFSRMSCAGTLAAASHAHANAASAAALLTAAFRDYKVQLQLADEMAQAKVSSTIAGEYSAGAGVTKAAAVVALATAQTFITAGALSPSIAVAATAVAFNAAAVVAAVLSNDRAEEAKVISEQRLVDFAVLLTDAQVMASAIFTHAIGADAAGTY